MIIGTLPYSNSVLWTFELSILNKLASFEIDDPQKLKMFADDSTILVAGRTLEYVTRSVLKF